MSKSTVEVSTNSPQLINTKELTISLTQVSLKYHKNGKFQEEKKSLEKENKESQDKIDKPKTRLIGIPAFQSTQHSLWDHISAEVAKMWDEFKKLESKKAYIYSDLDKCEVAKEKLQ